MNTWVRQLPITKLFAAYARLLTVSNGTLKHDLSQASPYRLSRSRNHLPMRNLPVFPPITAFTPR